MAKVFASAVVAAPIDQVWSLLRDYNGFPNWVPGIIDSSIEGGRPADAVGSIRDLSISAGQVREKLLALSDIDFSYTYNILSAPFEIANFLCTLKLAPVTDVGATFIQWCATFDCKSADEAGLVESIGDGVFRKGLANLKLRFT